MKSLVRNLLSVTLSILLANTAHAGVNQWISTGPTARSVFALAVDPNTPAIVYAGTDQGVFKSIDSGGSWSVTGLVAGQVNALAIDPVNPTILYAGTTQGIFKSIDGGMNWQARNQGLSITESGIQTVAIDPLTPTTVYAITYRIFKSPNGGTDWNELGADLEGGDVVTFAIDPQNPQILYAGTTRVVNAPFFGTRDVGRVFHSADGGTHWTKTTLPIAPAHLAVVPLSPTTLYAAGIYGATYKSTDRGDTWSEVSPLSGPIVIDPLYPSNLYQGTVYAGVVRTTNDGVSWASINNGVTDTAHVVVQALAVSPANGGTLYVGVRNGGAFGGGGVFVLQRPDAVDPDIVAYIESPEQGQTVSSLVMVRGWAFATRTGQSLQNIGLQVDEGIGAGIGCCSERKDVEAAFPSFPSENTRNSGWGVAFNWEPVRDFEDADPHTFVFWISDTAGDVFVTTLSPVFIVRPGEFAFLQRFDLSFAHASIVAGDLLLDDVIVQDKKSGFRSRVNTRFRWITNAQTLGIVQSETVEERVGQRFSPFQSGAALLARSWHFLSRPSLAHAAGGIVSYFESPDANQIISGVGIIRGWAFPEDGNASVKTIRLAVDGVPNATVSCCAGRFDVATAFPQANNASRSGWGLQFNYGEMSPGVHTLTTQLEATNGETQTLTRTIETIKIGGFDFLDLFDLTNAIARIDGEEIVLSNVLLRDKASQQTKVIEVRLRWFQHSQSLGIVASSS